MSCRSPSLTPIKGQTDITECIDEDNILLKACPGSGKTRTLTYKLAYLVEKYIDSRKLNIAITWRTWRCCEVMWRIAKGVWNKVSRKRIRWLLSYNTTDS